MTRESVGLLLGFVGVVLFGGTLPATRMAVADLAPWFVTLGRAALAGLLAASVLLILRRQPPHRSEWLRYGLGSACLVIGFPGFVGLAMQHVPASHGGVVLGILPLATALCSALIGGERPSVAFWIWGALGTLMVIVFTLRESGFALALGDAYLVGAVVCTALGYTLSADLSRGKPGWEVISWQLIIALPLTVPLAFVVLPPSPAAISMSSWMGFGYVTLISQYLGFFAWNAGLAMGGVARVSQVQLLQTFVTLALSALVLNERIGPDMLIFAVAVVIVVALGRQARIRRT